MIRKRGFGPSFVFNYICHMNSNNDSWLYFNTADTDGNTIAIKASSLYAVDSTSPTAVTLRFKQNGVTSGTVTDFATVALAVTSGKSQEVIDEVWHVATKKLGVFQVIADDANGEYIDNVTACGAITVNV